LVSPKDGSSPGGRGSSCIARARKYLASHRVALPSRCLFLYFQTTFIRRLRPRSALYLIRIVLIFNRDLSSAPSLGLTFPLTTANTTPPGKRLCPGSDSSKLSRISFRVAGHPRKVFFEPTPLVPQCTLLCFPGCLPSPVFGAPVTRSLISLIFCHFRADLLPSDAGHTPPHTHFSTFFF